MMEPARPSVAIIHYTAPPIVGGVEAVMGEHARMLLDAGYPVRIIVGRGGTDGLPEAVDVRLIPEIDSEYPENQEVAAALDRGVVPNEFRTLRDQIESRLAEALEGIDVVIIHNVMTMHFNLPLTAALNRLLDAGRMPRTIVWTHDGSWEDPMQRKHVQPRYPWDLLKKYRRDVQYVVVSAERQKAFARLFKCPQYKLRVIPNGVHARFFWNLTLEGDDLINHLELLDGDLFILQPTRITKLKNIAYSLRVVAALKTLGLAPRFAVTGPPDPHDPEGNELFEGLRALRCELGLEREALFLCEESANCEKSAGPVEPRLLPFTVVRDLYTAADVILLPSLAEGFGIPLIEAGLMSRPVFCSDIGPFREIGGDLVHRFKLSEAPGMVALRIASWAERDRGYKMRRHVWHNYRWRAIMENHLEPLLNVSRDSTRAAIPVRPDMPRQKAA